MPWNLIAWQLVGERGIEILQRNEDESDYYGAPPQSLWKMIFDEVEQQGLGALILLDEFLMWAHGAASPHPDSARQDKGPVWYGRLKNFFQNLAQAASGSTRSCLVVSLLATDPAMRNEVGTEVLANCKPERNLPGGFRDRQRFAAFRRRASSTMAP